MKNIGKWLTISLCIISIVSLGWFAYKEYSNRDTKPPEISFENDTLEISIDAEDEVFLEGVKAKDDVDGDLTDNVFIEGVVKDTGGSEKEFEITYVVFDSNDNVAKKTRKLIYTDYHSPRFYIHYPARMTGISQAELYTLVTAEDCIDGDITSSITVQEDDLFTQELAYGVHECTLEVTNSLGDTKTFSLEFELYEDTYEERTFRPVINLTDYVVYINKGDKEFKPTAYLDYVEDGGRMQIDYGQVIEYIENGETLQTTQAIQEGKPGEWINIAQITIASNVDVNTPGKYLVEYSYTSMSTGYSCSTKMYVIVGGE